MRLIIPTSTRWALPTRQWTADVESQLVGEAFEDFDRIVDSFLRPDSYSSVNFQPRIDLNETENHYMASFDMPGVKKDDIKIEMRGRQLVVTGERRSEIKNSSHRTTGKFERAFTLPESVDAEKIEAHYEDGVLNIALPKAEAAKPRTIEIQTANGGFFNKLLGSKKEGAKEIQDIKLS